MTSDENPADVIEHVVELLRGLPELVEDDIARVLHDAGLLADPTDKRPCKGRNSNICVAEGCYGEACIRSRPTDVIEQSAKVIMRHFNPSPDGSWRLNPSEAARALHEAGLLHTPQDDLDLGDYEQLKAENTRLTVRVVAAEAEVARLQRWKDEASPVMLGLQDLGKALGIPLGTRITGEVAAEKAQALTDEVAELRADFAKLRGEHTFKCCELDRAYEERDELLETVDRVADEWEREARQVAGPSSARLFANRLRAALDPEGGAS